MAVESATEAAIAQRLWTVDEYYRMAENGILKPDERVELIEGVVVAMPPIGPEHAGSVDRLGDLMRSLLGSTVIVRVKIRLASKKDSSSSRRRSPAR